MFTESTILRDDGYNVISPVSSFLGGARCLLNNETTVSIHQPMFMGEVASLSAHIVFTSPHSVLVKVIVTAENLDKGKTETRVTNRAGELLVCALGSWRK